MKKINNPIETCLANNDEDGLRLLYHRYSSCDDTKLHESFADAFYSMHLFNEASIAYGKLLKLNALKKRTLYRVGNCFFAINDIDSALSIFARLVASFPAYLPGHVKLSKCFLRQGDARQALKAVDCEVTDAVPGAADIYAQKAFCLKALKKHHDAILNFRKALAYKGEKKTQKAFWSFSIAKCYKEIACYDHAILYFYDAINLGEQKDSLYKDLAFLLYKRCDYERCIEIANISYAQDSTNYEILIIMGDCKRRLGKSEAVHFYQAAIQKGCAKVPSSVFTYLVDNDLAGEALVSDLIGPNRFDIYFKILYIESFFKKHVNSSIDLEALYLRHIYLRTKGVEPFSNVKTNLQKYILEFKSLIRSFQANGFDFCFPIPLAKNDELLNGAHRLAVSLYFDIKNISFVYLSRDVGINWDFNWFVDKGFNRDELNELLLCWVRYNRKARIVVLWPAVEKVWSEIINDISEDVNIVTSIEHSFSDVGFSEIVKDIYSLDSVAEFMPSIIKKISFLSSFNNKIKVLFVEDTSDKLLAVKDKLRDKYEHLVPKDVFSTIHASDSFEETSHLASIFLHKQTLELINSRSEGLSYHLCEWIKEAKVFFSSMNVPHAEICAVGGAVLNAYGIRNADDLDVCVSKKVRDTFFEDGPKAITKNIDVVRKGYSKDVVNFMSDDQLIFDRSCHVYIRGFKFANLEVVRKRKAYSQREKDLKDLAKIGHSSWS
ncbi:tetratricopeptide repeat protein [Halomonas sp. 141]|uniref:tetratricopeptide repeat protein n=1 Tax=Halomonas sp. 141 TaxID=2056666 RepID=UPI001E4662B0|nr:tetratricopeptide repeat protein [Halomonas sp. 141]